MALKNKLSIYLIKDEFADEDSKQMDARCSSRILGKLDALYCVARSFAYQKMICN